MYCFLDDNNIIQSIFDSVYGLTDSAKAKAKELIVKGLELKNINIYVDKDTVITKEYPYYMCSPKIDYDKLEWVETATQEEIEEFEWKEEVKFYNKELEFASKATAELACEIITPEMYEDVKMYMRSIDPYANGYNRDKRAGRPPVFDRYN